MSEAESSTEAHRWLRYALEDLRAAEVMIGQSHIAPRHVCWLAQQAAEKAIKAALIYLQIDFPRSHDLDALRNLLPDSWRVKEECPDLAVLTEWSVEARYPGDAPDAIESDARQAVQESRAVIESISRDLARCGFAHG